MDTRGGQVALFAVLYTAVALALFLLLRRRRPALSFAALVAPYGSVMAVLWALHPLVFAVPNNFAMLREGWAAYWFTPRFTPGGWDERGLVVAIIASCLLATALLAWRFRALTRPSA